MVSILPTGSATSLNHPQRGLLFQLMIFLDFMYEHLSGPIKLYDDIRAGRHMSVSFENLWMQYKPDDILYTPFRKAEPPPKPAMSPPVNSHPFREGLGRATPQAYQVIAVIGGRPFSAPSGDPYNKPNWFTDLTLLCYFVDFDGARCVATQDAFISRSFNGEIDIRNLDAYPLAYAAIDEHHIPSGMAKYLKDRGRKFIDCSEVSHKLYEGMIIGDTREEINTPVTIDFLSCYQSAPQSRPLILVPMNVYFTSRQLGGRPPGRSELHEVVTRDRRKGDWYWDHVLGLVTKARYDIVHVLSGYPSVTPTDSGCIGRLQERKYESR